MHAPIVVIIIFLQLNLFCSGQKNESAGSALYVELAGKGFFSLNIDFRLSPKNRLTVGLTALDHEFSKIHIGDENYSTLTLPTPSIMYFRLFGKERHYFEAGGGISISPLFWKKYSPNDSPISLHGSLGYRFQAPNKLFLRAGFTPFYRFNWAFLPLPGVSIGYCW